MSRVGWVSLLAAAILTGCHDAEPSRIELNPRVALPITPPEVSKQDKILRVFTHENSFPPLDFGLPASGPPRGIYPEILGALSRKTGIAWVPVALPPGRVYEGFRSQDSNVEIGCNPAWRTNEADISLYTDAFATDSNVLAFRKNHRFVLPKADGPVAPPKTVGTIIGYVYPSLEPLFHAGSLVRQDVSSEKTLMEVLAAGRVDAIIITRLVALYYLKIGSYDFELSEPRDALPLSIRIHTNLAWALEPLNRALRELADDGTIEKIYQKYR